MKLVIDGNQLQSEQLANFLNKSPRNAAVLPDFAAMEAHKGNFLRSMTVLSQFPHQVIVLKSSDEIRRLSGRARGLQQRLINEEQTRGFPDFVRALRLADAGDKWVLEQLEDKRRLARDHFDEMRLGVEEIRGSLAELGRQYTKEERAALRSGNFTPEWLDKFVQMPLAIAAKMFNDPWYERKPPPHDELLNTHVFRVTLACYLVVIKQVARGGVDKTSADKLRNDFVDMALVAYGTFFDGVMSADANLNELFSDVSRILAALRTC